MLFDSNHSDIMGMMDWGPNFWIILIFGVVAFFLIVIILLYMLTKGSNQSRNKEISTVRMPKNLAKNIQSKKFRAKGEFCPNCGQKIRDKSITYCSFCGIKI